LSAITWLSALRARRLARHAGGFYGVGTTNGEPGYFFAHGIYQNGRIIGVATVKVNIERLERSWEQGADKVLLADANGVVFLSSVAEWKYHTLAAIDGGGDGGAGGFAPVCRPRAVAAGHA
jgi:C4-dicarboxylate-specific signal transduction histidine kinase